MVVFLQEENQKGDLGIKSSSLLEIHTHLQRDFCLFVLLLE